MSWHPPRDLRIIPHLICMTGLQKLVCDGERDLQLEHYSSTKGHHKHLCSLGVQNQPATYSLRLDIPLSCSLKGTPKWLLVRSVLDTLRAAQDRKLICCLSAISSFNF